MSKRQYQSTDHSFVICAYKESPYLEECIWSVTHQQQPGKVLLATSTPCRLIESLAKKYQIPLYVRKGPETGIAEDWNFALSVAATSLVTIAHQDDVYGKWYTRSVVEAANQCKRPLIVFTDYVELREGITVVANRLLRIKRLMLFPLLLPAFRRSIFVRRRILSMGSAICCPSVTICRDHVTLPVFENNMKSNIDWQAWEKLSRQQGEFAYIGHPLVKHRIHSDSTTTDLLEKDGRKAEDLNMFRKFWPERIARWIEYFYQSGEKSNSLRKADANALKPGN